MYLIVGLGNPGPEYEKTRHNVGFMVVSEIAKRTDGKFSSEPRVKGSVAKVIIGEKATILLKPDTYMNLSGDSLAQAASYYTIPYEQIIAVSDDANLELGQIRVRFGGAAGGHKGLSSIISRTGINFWRVRIGIGSNRQIPLEKYVLRRFSDDENKTITSAIDETVSYLIESIPQDSLENKTIN